MLLLFSVIYNWPFGHFLVFNDFFYTPTVFIKNVQTYIQMEIIVQWTPEYYHLDTIVNILLHLCVYFLILFFFAALDH